MTLQVPAPVLEVEHLTISYRTPAGRLYALRDISLAIASGEILGLAGESGSGKSTLAYAITRYLAGNAVIEGGTIRFEGSDLLRASTAQLETVRGRRIGMVYQDPNTALNPTLRIGEQIAELLVLHAGLDRRHAWVGAIKWLGQVALSDPHFSATKFPHEISGGERQRVLIAMAFACRPSLLIFDEPTTALDATTSVEILDLLRELQRETTSAALFISHDLGVIRSIAQRVSIIYAGTTVEEGDVGEVLLRPRHPYTRGLLASLPGGAQAGRGRHLTVLGGIPPDLHAPPHGCILQQRCPFVAEACRDRLPPLIGSTAHRDACLRSDETKDQPLPAPSSARPIHEQRTRAEGLLEVRKLSVTYGRARSLDGLLGRPSRSVRAVDELDLTLGVGETLAIVGESGCGKSSLARALVGLVPSTGSIRLENHKVEWSNAASRHFFRRAVQIIFQQPGLSLNPRMKIGAIISRPVRLSGMTDASGLEFGVEKMLDQVRLPPAYADRFPHEISGGEKQRVAIARAFAARPRVVICDEITAGLDASVQATIINLLGDLQAEFGTAYIFISHDLNLVRHFADWVAVMYLGRIVEIRRAGELLHPPYHPYTEALLSAAFPSNPALTALPIRLHGIRPDPKNPPAGCAFHTRCPRRLGAICAIEPPPLRTITADHRFTCHIEPAILSAVPEVWQVRDAVPLH